MSHKKNLMIKSYCITVPEPPLNVNVLFCYSYLRGDAVGFTLEFTDLVNTIDYSNINLFT